MKRQSRGLDRRPRAERAVIVGAGPLGQRVAEAFLHHPEHRIAPIGFVDSDPDRVAGAAPPIPVLGRPEHLRAIVREHAVGRVVLAYPGQPDERGAAVIRSLAGLGVGIDVAPPGAEGPAGPLPFRRVDGLRLVELRSLRLSGRQRALKRALDVSLSAVGLALVWPLLAAIAVWIKLDSPGPVFFDQVRIGRGNRRFRVYKFRTMALGADERKVELAGLNAHALNGGDPRLFKIAGDPRVTRVGRLLRRYFLDELPQLLNVLKGEMSLVGPRPLIPEEDGHVADWARTRLDLRPGMTGFWQVLGHSAIPFEQMLKLDYLYVTTWSLPGDLRLLARTIPVVLRGGGGSY